MEELGSMVVEKLREVTKSAQKFTDNLFRGSFDRNPIQILKSLQREAFSDIMKLRDRQEKVEKLMNIYKSSRGSPFQEAGTLVRGRVDVLGALFLIDDVDEQKYEAIQKTGIPTGIDARLTFKARVGDKDALVAEFIANEKGRSDAFGGPLSLSKVLCSAHICDWLSAVAIPLGAQCRDAMSVKDSYQERGFTDYSGFGPPLLHHCNGSAVGVTVTTSRLSASLAQFLSGLGIQINSAGMCTGLAHTYCTFVELALLASRNTTLSVLCVNSQSRPSGQGVNLGTFALPVSIFKRNNLAETSSLTVGDDEEDSPTSWERSISDRSVAILMNSEIDESRRIGGWVEIKNSDLDNLEGAVTLRDTPEGDLGWGLTVGGSLKELKNVERFQVEGFLNLNLHSKFKIQPALLYVKDGSSQFPALMLRSTWNL